MMLEVCWNGLWTLSFGLSQFHGHGSWLVCEVALIIRKEEKVQKEKEQESGTVDDDDDYESLQRSDCSA